MQFNLDQILRFSQFLCGLIAMSCISGAFKVVNGFQLGSTEFTFLFLLNFCIWIYSLTYLYRYYIMKRQFPQNLYLYGFEILFIICLFSGSIAGVVANIYENCDKLSNVNCGALTTGIVFSFLNLGLSLFIMYFNIQSNIINNTIDMDSVSTPVGNPL